MSNLISHYFNRCVNCSESTEKEQELFCLNCIKQIKRIHKPYCVKCGYPYPAYMDSCVFCQDMKFDQMRSIFQYEGIIKDHIVELKYNQRMLNTLFFKKIFKKYLNYIDLDFSKYDYLIPVPISFASYWKRGFNQAEVFIGIVSGITGIKNINNLIKQKNSFEKQKNLNRSGRKAKKSSFVLNSKHVEIIKNKELLLIDDVATTLKTVNDISLLLKSAGVKSIAVLTVARTILKPKSSL